MTENNLTTADLLGAVSPVTAHDLDALITKATYKSGQEISFDGGTWGMIEEVVGKDIWVTDKDGGDHELTEARIDAILPDGPCGLCAG